ncbi:MAG: NAD-dependent epimerase/dehydratase family protein, partial [Candidatus Omnitrophota bacterium]
MSVDGVKQKVLITGASGCLGIHLIRFLLDKGFSVRALVRKSSKIEAIKDLDVEIFYGDLKEKETFIDAVEGVDTVVHAAAAVRGTWQEYLESTVKGTENLLQACRNNNIKKFIYISSIGVSDFFASLSDGKEINEETPYLTAHLTSYVRSKIEAEKVVLRYYEDYKFPVVIIRPGPIYGPGFKLYPPRLGYPLGAKRILVAGEGKNTMPYVYVDNLSQAIFLTLQNGKAAG